MLVVDFYCDGGYRHSYPNGHKVRPVTLSFGPYRRDCTRLHGWNYASPGWYFVTICTLDRAYDFGEVVSGAAVLSQVGRIADNDLKGLPSHYTNVKVDCAVVMPNHIHAVIVIAGCHQFSPKPNCPTESRRSEEFPDCSPASGSLSAIVRSYKAGVTRRCRLAGLRFAWQSGFYDHILRTNHSLNAVRDYIQNNPRNWDEDPDNLQRVAP